MPCDSAWKNKRRTQGENQKLMLFAVVNLWLELYERVSVYQFRSSQEAFTLQALHHFIWVEKVRVAQRSYPYPYFVFK